MDHVTQKVLGTAATTTAKDGHTGGEIQALTVQQLQQIVNQQVCLRIDRNSYYLINVV